MTLSWKEITFYLTMMGLAISAGALHVVDKDIVTYVLSNVITFVMGRIIPTPDQKRVQAIRDEVKEGTK